MSNSKARRTGLEDFGERHPRQLASQNDTESCGIANSKITGMNLGQLFTDPEITVRFEIGCSLDTQEL
jgi:hypothetical protein